MEIIGLRAKAHPLEGTIEHYRFEEHVGIARTLFHRVRIPFEPFDSGLLTRDDSRYRVASVGTVEFAREGVANDERFAFEAMAVYHGAA